MTSLSTTYDSPLGPLTIYACAATPTARLARLRFPAASGPCEEPGRPGGARRPDLFAAAVRQLDEYFAGDRDAFELALDLEAGTAFQRDVWEQLQQIPFGATVSYTELAQAIGRPDRVRAVAAAVGQTPVPIVIPCHRVVGADGALTGYVGGLRRKQALLALEGRAAAGLAPEPAWAFRQLALLPAPA